jgi:hypothetical protein
MTFSPPNDRIFSACQAVMVKSRTSTSTGGSESPTDADILEGVQSVGVSRELTRNPIADIGRMQNQYGRWSKITYTINVSRVIAKQTDFFYNTTGLSSYEDSHILSTATSSTLGFTGFNGRLKNYDLCIVYTPDSYSFVGGGSDASPVDNQCQTQTYRCCLLTSVSYSIGVDGFIQEDLTFITFSYTQDDVVDITDFTVLSGVEAFPHLNRSTFTREDIDLANCIFPLEVEKAYEIGDSLSGIPIFALQQIEINIEIAYRDIPDIGQWRGSVTDRAEMNKFRQVELPVGVSCTFSGVTRAQYFVNGSAQDHNVTDTYHSAGTYGSESKGIQNYKSDREIRIVANGNSGDYFQWNLGSKNYISSFDVTGGDAGGEGNVETSMSFQNDHSEIFLLKDTTLRDFTSTTTY